MNDNIRKYVLPNLPYAFIGLLIGNVGEAYRMAIGANFGQKLVAMMQSIGPAFGNILPGPHPSDWMVGLVGSVLLRLYVWQKSKKGNDSERMWSTDRPVGDRKKTSNRL